MISGPPGIGKTTSAHLCAKLAGFTPIELNASDARSKKLVEVRYQTRSADAVIDEPYRIVRTSRIRLWMAGWAAVKYVFIRLHIH
jgi:DNA polymerase III delta prime subunit